MSILLKYASLLEQNEALAKENAELKAWKESALSLNAEMDEQYLAKMLGGELGRSCRKIIAERVPMLVEENAALRAEIKSVLDALNTAANEGGFDGYDEDTPLLVNLTSHWDRLYMIADKEVEKVQKENSELKEALKEIATTAHCIALSGPLNTPTLQDAWSKFMKIDSMASNALAKNKTNG